MNNRCAIELHLHIRVTADKRDALLEFLRQAKLFYEQPGGIRMRLLEDSDDELAFIEIFEYQTIDDYQADEQRVANDPDMKKVLAAWRSLLNGPPSVKIYVNQSEALEESESPVAEET
jgi:quinol monooxygenase YgiN